jgi:hypothetical protein
MLYSPGKEPVVIALMEFTYSSLQVHINPLKMKHICVIYGLSPYRAVNTLHLGSKNQRVNVV